MPHSALSSVLPDHSPVDSEIVLHPINSIMRQSKDLQTIIIRGDIHLISYTKAASPCHSTFPRKQLGVLSSVPPRAAPARQLGAGGTGPSLSRGKHNPCHGTGAAAAPAEQAELGLGQCWHRAKSARSGANVLPQFYFFFALSEQISTLTAHGVGLALPQHISSGEGWYGPHCSVGGHKSCTGPHPQTTSSARIRRS